CPPFSGASPYEALKKVLEDDPPRPLSIRRGVDRDLETICLKCLRKLPEQRYASAAALADDLERWLRHEPIEARPSRPWEKLRKYVRRHPAAAALVAVSTLGMLAVVTVLSLSVLWITKSFHAEQDTAYIQRINRAQSEWQAGNITRAEQLLAECPPELRSWE